LQAYDFLIAVAEPVCRPEYIHEYVLTPHSLYAAVSVGLDTQTIINVLNKLSKVQLTEDLSNFIRRSTQNYGKVGGHGVWQQHC
jgi:DNA excision repair protein ERCC-3